MMYTPFGQTILLIPFHSILFFHIFQSSKPFHSIPLFLIIFFNFPNPYTISLNLNHLYHLEICKVKPFSITIFQTIFQTIFKPFRMVKNDQNGFPKRVISPCLSQPFSSFHSILFFHFFQSSKLFHYIPLFSTIFFNFPNPYTISLNLNHLYHLEICKVKLFSKSFFKPFSTIFKPFRMVKNGWNGFPKHHENCF